MYKRIIFAVVIMGSSAVQSGDNFLPIKIRRLKKSIEYALSGFTSENIAGEAQVIQNQSRGWICFGVLTSMIVRKSGGDLYVGVEINRTSNSLEHLCNGLCKDAQSRLLDSSQKSAEEKLRNAMCAGLYLRCAEAVMEKIVALEKV